MNLSYEAVDNYQYAVWRILAVLHGCDRADTLSYPLRYYIKTGRASGVFLRSLLEIPAARIAESLAEERSVDEAINRLKDMVY